MSLRNLGVLLMVENPINSDSFSFLQKALVLESLASLSLPDSHCSLLQPSAQLGRVKRTRRHILNDAHLRDRLLGLNKTLRGDTQAEDRDLASVEDVASLVGTTWRRRNRKRRTLKAEKVLFHPKVKQDVNMAEEGVEHGAESDGSISESAEEDNEG